MGTIILTYDIERTTSTIHTEVKNAMIAKGYSDTVPLQNGSKAKLPNTTLMKENTTPAQAATDLEMVCKNNRAVLEKYLTLPTSLSDGRAKVLK